MKVVCKVEVDAIKNLEMMLNLAQASERSSLAHELFSHAYREVEKALMKVICTGKLDPIDKVLLEKLAIKVTILETMKAETKPRGETVVQFPSGEKNRC